MEVLTGVDPSEGDVVWCRVTSGPSRDQLPGFLAEQDSRLDPVYEKSDLASLVSTSGNLGLADGANWKTHGEGGPADGRPGSDSMSTLYFAT